MNENPKVFSVRQNYAIADTAVPVAVAAKMAGADLKALAPVLLKEGKVTPVTDSANTADLYGLAAEAVPAGKEAVIFLSGAFFADALALEAGVTAADLELPLRRLGIFLRPLDRAPWPALPADDLTENDVPGTDDNPEEEETDHA